MTPSSTKTAVAKLKARLAKAANALRRIKLSVRRSANEEKH